MEIGPVSSGSMGEGPITWEAMEAWQRITGIELDAWEARTIRHLSDSYLKQRYDAKKPDCPEPYGDEADEAAETEDPVTAQFRAMKEAFATREASQT